MFQRKMPPLFNGVNCPKCHSNRIYFKRWLEEYLGPNTAWIKCWSCNIRTHVQPIIMNNIPTKITAKYTDMTFLPICESHLGTLRIATDNYGDIECPFCDKVICNENKELHIGTKCGFCSGIVISFKPAGPSMENILKENDK